MLSTSFVHCPGCLADTAQQQIVLLAIRPKLFGFFSTEIQCDTPVVNEPPHIQG